MTTETQTLPTLESPPTQWPPVAHIIRNEDRPPREGTIALCGAKLMGVDLGRLRDAEAPVCAKCLAEFKRMAGL